MTPTASALAGATSLPALSQLVSSATSSFPADGLVAGPADTQTDLVELLPSEDSFVVVLTVDGEIERHLVVAVSPALLSAMGLVDADGLAAALAPVLVDLSGEGTVDLDGARLGVGTIGLAGLPVSGGIASERLVAAGLFLGSDHVATVGVGVRGSDANEDPDADTAPMSLPDVGATRSRPPTAAAPGGRSLDLLRNVEMNVTAELGRSKMTVAELLSLTPGSVVELDRAAGTPIDLLVNGTLIARGEVVVIDEEYGVRISEIVDRVDGV